MIVGWVVVVDVVVAVAVAVAVVLVVVVVVVVTVAVIVFVCVILNLGVCVCVEMHTLHQSIHIDYYLDPSIYIGVYNENAQCYKLNVILL